MIKIKRECSSRLTSISRLSFQRRTDPEHPTNVKATSNGEQFLDWKGQRNSKFRRRKQYTSFSWCHYGITWFLQQMHTTQPKCWWSKFLKGKNEILAHWAQYFENLLNTRNPLSQSILNRLTNLPQALQPNVPPSLSEVPTAILCCKHNKSEGSDGLHLRG